MKALLQSLASALLAALIALAFCGMLFIRRATDAVSEVANARMALTDQAAATRVALIGQIASLRIDTLAEIDKQADGLRGELHGDVRLVDSQMSWVTGRMDKRTADVLARVDTALKTVDDRTGEALKAVDGIRTDLKPTLLNSAALVKDAQDSWDDSYDDVRSLLDSAEVATTQAAQTLETVNKAAPAQLAAEQKTADAVAGITTDAHAMTTAALKPKSIFGKIWAAITVTSRFAGLM